MEPKYIQKGNSQRINPKYHETRSDKGFYVLGNLVMTAIVTTAVLYGASLLDSYINSDTTEPQGIEYIVSK
jgi:hypothetical protein